MTFSGTSRFQLLGKLGQGGMGIVYEAMDLRRGMRVAIKTLKHLDPGGLYRFKREFRELTALSHPNIITLYELVFEGSEWFFTMELVGGEHFLDYVRHGRTPAAATESFTPQPQDLPHATQVTQPTKDEPPLPAAPASVVPAFDGDTITRTASRPLQPSDFLPRNQDETDTHSMMAGIESLSMGASMGPGPHPRQTSASKPPALPRDRSPLDHIVDEVRLRESAVQLANALAAMHAAGLVHRDLKPSNVRVTPTGRVVLMDFGVVTAVRGRVSWDRNRRAVGTPAFMAPEQVAGIELTSAADWYAFGVLLYLALTHHLPYDGNVIQILDDKRDRDPPPPSAYVLDVPEDLEDLCVRLLDRNPRTRAGEREVLATLGSAPLHNRAKSSLRHTALDSQELRPFVGRASELASLRASYRDMLAGDAACVLIFGPSGIGKTSLVDQFLLTLPAEAAAASAAKPTLLFGRCHERENLPYKAFDGVMDSLSGYLLDVPRAQRNQLEPEDSAILVRLFPVLQSVLRHPDAQESADEPAPAPHQVGTVLRALLAKLADKGPLIIRIEDLQWVDAESLTLLLGLARPSLPAGILVLATMRSEADATDPDTQAQVEATLGELAERRQLRRLRLSPLSESEQRRLFRSCIQDPIAERDEQYLIAQAGGSPMLVVELAHHAQHLSQERHRGRALTIEDILHHRMAHLPGPVRALVETVAVAGEPLPLSVLAAAAGLDDNVGERAASLLHIGHWVRFARSSADPWLGAYHDKISDAIRARLSASRVRSLHRALAAALESTGHSSPVQLAQHWQAAGEAVRAAGYFIAAADRASEQLAFARAAEYYREVLALVAPPATAKNSAPHPCGGDSARMHCQASLGLAEGLRIVGHFDEALAILADIEPIADGHDLERELTRLCNLRGNLLFPSGDMEGCFRAHERVRILAEKSGSDEDHALAFSGLGDVHYLRGDMALAESFFDRSLHLCHKAGLSKLAAANRAMRGMTRYYRNQLEDALKDGTDAALAAAEVGHQRAEIVARNGCVGWILAEMGRLDQAWREFESALFMARALGARHFEPHSLTWMAKIAALRGDQAHAEELIQQSLDICRDTVFAFVGPMALGVYMRISGDPHRTQNAFAEGQTFLSYRGLSHNVLYFYRDAMDAFYAIGDLDGVMQCADALERYGSKTPQPWSKFFVARARALAAPPRTATGKLKSLHSHAKAVGLNLAAESLAQAIERDRAA